MERIRRLPGRICCLLAAIVLLAGCATKQITAARPFAFGADTFAFRNELTWEYYYDENGKWTSRKRLPAPDYTLHCFPVARAAKLFFLNARFDPSQPAPSEAGCRELVRKVAGLNPRRALPEERKIVIPGYTNLNHFSREHEALLKEECGSAVSSYFQRGHWRMVLPFTGAKREKTALELLEKTGENSPAVVHVMTFPSLSINHAVLVFSANREGNGDIVLEYYDPNDSERPGWLRFDAERKRFLMQASPCFHGGEVQAYEVFHRWNY